MRLAPLFGIPLFGVIAAALLTGPRVAAEPLPKPVERCQVEDTRLAELSGLASDGESWYAVSDGGSSVRAYVLDPADCSVRDVWTSPVDPYDVEDLALGRDGALWLADTGDNVRQRDTIALHVLTADGESTFSRLTYPDGPHDAEALLLDRFGVPHIVTKEPFGNALVYRPDVPLVPGGTVGMRQVGALSLTPTDSPGGPASGGLGLTLVTGAAVNQDGTVLAIRTYSEAYLFSAPDGNVVSALQREPVRVPLANEPQGEAVAWEPDGTLLSGSEGHQQPIRAVQGAASAATARTSPPPGRSTAENHPAGTTSGGNASERAERSAPPAGKMLLLAGCIAALVLLVSRALRQRSR